MDRKNIEAIWSVGFLQGQYDAMEAGLSPDMIRGRAELENVLHFLAAKLWDSIGVVEPESFKGEEK